MEIMPTARSTPDVNFGPESEAVGYPHHLVSLIKESRHGRSLLTVRLPSTL